MGETVYALSTAPGRSAIAIVRITGPAAHRAAETLAGRKLTADRRLARTELRDPKTGTVLDDALVACFPAGGSFTGEPVAELHLHGGRAVRMGVLATLGEMVDLAPAEPGEFTRRAMEAGRLDLSQVESLADLIDAETEAQRVQALKMLNGALSSTVATWREQVIGVRALLEAGIDFADEEIPRDLIDEARARMSRLARDLEADLAGAEAAQAIRDGFEVALVGPPNVGKSTLMNRIAQREVALTSDVAGTTRDVIEVRCDLEGLCVTFLDMAGLREASDPIEKAGVLRARDRAIGADLRIFISDPDYPADLSLAQGGDLSIMNKSDLIGVGADRVSATTGAGVSELLERVAKTLSQRSAGASSLTRIRHQKAVQAALLAVRRAQDVQDVELMAEEMRRTSDQLDQIIGIVDVEHVLDDIFTRFCLGK